VTLMPDRHELDCDVVHYQWDNALSSRLTIEPGDTVVFRCRDGNDGFFKRSSTSGDVASFRFRGHPLTGPVYVVGARPGDVLQVDVLDLSTGDLGSTSFGRGGGVLPDEFPRPYLRLWDLRGRHTYLGEHIRVPVDPFLGVMGVALPERGQYGTEPPRKNGGNMDIRQLTAGSTLYLPVWVDGALFSCGDGHAAQGDGEVCGTAIETTMTATLRLSLRRDLHIQLPQFQTSSEARTGRHHVTQGIGPDLMAATKQAVRVMIEHLVKNHGLTREDAYVLCSVAVDLKISEVVDRPNWIVSAFLPLSLFV
jgi:acetamidase/formamidase